MKLQNVQCAKSCMNKTLFQYQLTNVYSLEFRNQLDTWKCIALPLSILYSNVTFQSKFRGNIQNYQSLNSIQMLLTVKSMGFPYLFDTKSSLGSFKTIVYSSYCTVGHDCLLLCQAILSPP